MLPTFVIALREGVEAALIVGIIAAFLKKGGRKEALRWVWLGVGIAVTLCAAVGVILQIVDQELPQRQQEGLETIVAAVAVGFVTYMIVWMRRHGKELKHSIENHANDAIANGSMFALVFMAFLAVLREGLETAVFFLAAFQSSSNTAASGTGAVLGLIAAIVIGALIYRGGVRIDLVRFFRITGFALVIVAAGLVMSALHTAHEAGWINFGQSQAMNLSWLVAPGSVRAAILTGTLGLQPKPVTIETIGWLLYLVPTMVYVLRKQKRTRKPQPAETSATKTANPSLRRAGV